jgi:hypothetical protein
MVILVLLVNLGYDKIKSQRYQVLLRIWRKGNLCILVAEM